MAKSIMQDKKECWLCRNANGSIELSPYGLEEHHCISGTANRKISEETGLKMWLCVYHHRLVHSCREAELIVKTSAQMKYEETHSREEFISKFGKSWL
ncbi:MAG: hypothetical protein KBT03_09205 [Bacteroidales bacterium]|nr:hypothetical protein [Candidatus Scybalousia scybalohippi]